MQGKTVGKNVFIQVVRERLYSSSKRTSLFTCDTEYLDSRVVRLGPGHVRSHVNVGYSRKQTRRNAETKPLLTPKAPKLN